MPILSDRVCNILILNAGVLASQHSLTEDGYESMWQVNHLSQLYLAVLLAPSLTTPARIIFVSCEAHRLAVHPPYTVLSAVNGSLSLVLTFLYVE